MSGYRHTQGSGFPGAFNNGQRSQGHMPQGNAPRATNWNSDNDQRYMPSQQQHQYFGLQSQALPFTPGGGGAPSANYPARPHNSRSGVVDGGDLISFDEDVTASSSNLTAPPTPSYSTLNYPSSSCSRDEDSRSESSLDGGRSTSSRTSCSGKGRGPRQSSSTTDFSASVNSNSSVDSLARTAAQLTLDSPTNTQLTLLPPVKPPVYSRHNEVLVAPKKAPALRHDKEKVMLTTNFYPLEVRNKVVYRYDVNVTLMRPSGRPNINLAKGPRDDAARTERNNFCLAALRSALETFRVMREGQAFVYDGASIMFSSDNLEVALKAPLTISPTTLPANIRSYLLHHPDVSDIAVEIVPCRDSASSFDISQFQGAQGNRDMAHLDRTWKQFFDMLTNQDSVSSGNFTLFGAGKLFSNHGRREDARGGQERVQGANKGIKFIEAAGNPQSAVAALVLDSKIGQFFKSQTLVHTICEHMNWPAHPNLPFPFESQNGRMNPTWKRVNDLIKGLRLTFADGQSRASFVAGGISNCPIESVFEESIDGRSRQPVLTRFPSVNPRDVRMHWPAVFVRSRQGSRVVDKHYPLDMLMIAPNQRVPKNKLDDNPPRADKPWDRFNNIARLMSELNLHDGGRFNQFLNAFGVSVSATPLRVEGIRRQRPNIAYADRQASLDQKASWKIPAGRYKGPAVADTIVFAYCCPRDIIINLQKKLDMMLKSRGVQVFNWDMIQYDTRCDMKESMDKLFAEIKRKMQENEYGGSKILVFYIDKEEIKSHGLLKLSERRYQILTQHITMRVALKVAQQGSPQTASNIINKLNCKLTGLNHSVIPDSYTQNAWITDNRSLIIGYDVAHPPPQLRSEILDRKPPLSPSVVGFSFNGGPHSESFIGDFHYQEPRKEEVCDSVLIQRVKWMLDLYCLNRNRMPENIFVIRDGVSEGQYRMTLDREMGAIRQGVEEYSNKMNMPDYKPKYVCVVVTKRHNARFFVKGPQGVDNPLPGTVVDNAVTRNDMTEFYMQSHRVLQGTGKSPSYVVLVDELNLSMDQLQSFLLALCFNHQIFEGAISLPEPVYQADEWAKRGNDIWKAYDDHFNLRFCDANGEFSSPPVDFEKMTKMLSYQGTGLEQCRVNA